MLTLSIYNSQNLLQASASGNEEAVLVYEPEYAPGDYITLTNHQEDTFLVIRLDDALAEAFVFLKGGSCRYEIPFGEAKKVFSERAFRGHRHYLQARLARPEEIACRKNLALNPYAAHAPGGPMPYASANVETRGEMVFAAKNAIDGMKANHYHGEWPYTSWGINRDPNAAWRLDFGRRVRIDEAVIYLRADFPHDAWWRQVTLHFSDGSQIQLDLEKTDAGQRFKFPEKRTEWVVLDQLIKAEDPSPFPALTQLELWGTEDNHRHI